MLNVTRKKSTRAAAICVTSALSLATLVAAPSGACAVDDNSTSASLAVIAESLANVESAEVSLLREPVGNSGVGTNSLLSGSVTVPATLSDGVTMDGSSSEFHVELPNAASAGSVQTLGDGTVIYPGVPAPTRLL